MGLRGPAKKPTAIRILEGNPSRRPIDDREPKPRDVAPECPAHISDDPLAKAEWERLVPLLLRMRVLTEADGIVLANLCLTHSFLMLNLSKMRELNASGKSGMAGIIIQTATGYLAPNQIYLNIQKAIEQELKLCHELGLSPSARARLQVAPEEQKRGGGLLNGEWQRSG